MRAGWRGLTFAGLILLLVPAAHGYKRGDKSPPVMPSADQVLAQAEATARSEHKHILLVFGASWCGPCQMLNKFFEDPQAGPALEKNFVIAHLFVGEKRGDLAHANNPGGIDEMERLGGGDAGYPYVAIVDEDGGWIADSKMPGEDGPGTNFGYPSSRAEIDWFMRMMKKAAPQMDPADAKVIRDWLDQRAS